MISTLTVIVTCFLGSDLIIAQCPFNLHEREAGLQIAESVNALSSSFGDALHKLDWQSVENDIRALLTNSQSFWPADFGNYGQ